LIVLNESLQVCQQLYRHLLLQVLPLVPLLLLEQVLALLLEQVLLLLEHFG
jgi:hypothetical protein